MTRPRRGTRRREIGPLGVAERLADAPPTRYTYKPKRPRPTDTYAVDGVTHTYDGKCHADCRNVQ